MVWERRLTNQGLGGVCATRELVVVVDRDPADAGDIFRCFDAVTGDERWTIRYPAPGNLDYGNSPRATPLVVDDLVYLFGAFGQLTCAALKTGEIVWRRDLRREFLVTERLVWGFAASPTAVDDKLIVQPGGPASSLVALDLRSGKTLWQTPGEPAAFASPIVAELGGLRQLVGYDKSSLGGWDIATGRRLWRLAPPEPDDFNVPTPLVVGRRLLVSTENNGTRLYDFAADGKIVPQPVAIFDDLAPDTHSPVAVAGRVFGIWGGSLYCLDTADGLKQVYAGDNDAFRDYASTIASDDRLLIVAQNADVLLIDPRAAEFQIVSRWKLLQGESGLYAHPAVVGDRLYVRSSDRILCVSLR